MDSLLEIIMSFKSKGLTGKSSLGSEAFEDQAAEEALKNAMAARQVAARELQKKAKTRKGLGQALELGLAATGGIVGGIYGGPKGAVEGTKLGKQVGGLGSDLIEGGLTEKADKVIEETEKMKRMRAADQPKEVTDIADKGLQIADSGLEIAKFLEKIGAFKENG
jgi:outer membrane lipoprotein SlyB